MRFRLIVDDFDLMSEKFSRWYGFSYCQFEVRRTVLYIIPFHLIIRYALKMFWRLKYWFYAGGWRDELDKAYWRGYNDASRKFFDSQVSDYKRGREKNCQQDSELINYKEGKDETATNKEEDALHQG